MWTKRRVWRLVKRVLYVTFLVAMAASPIPVMPLAAMVKRRRDPEVAVLVVKKR
jgi:hypothetical protein